MNAPTPETSRAGFGLVELLVAVAIFITIIGAVSLIFTGSLRSLRQAEQNQEMYEMIRGAMQVMERDLNNAFVAREYGDIYQFYGTPIGFTFVGLVKHHPGDEANLARVTYVLRRDSGKVTERAEFNSILNSDGLPYFENDLVDNDGDGTIDEVGELGQVPTFSLMRIVERGMDNLETFPIDWDDPGLITDDPNGLVALPNTLGDLVGYPEDVVTSLTYANSVQYAIDNGLCRPDDTRCLQEVAKAARRQIWIAMLAGQDTALFDFPALATSVDLPDYLELEGLDPEDYVLIENIVVEDAAAAFANLETLISARSDITTRQNPLGEFEAVSYSGQFFQYSEWVPGFVLDTSVGPPPEPLLTTKPNAMAFWLDWRNIDLSNNGIDDNNSCCDGVDNDGVNGIDDPGEALLVDCDVLEVIAGAPDDSDATDNNGNGIIDCPDQGELPYPVVIGPPHEWNYAPGPGPGSPLSPSIPQQMNVRFRVFAEAPTIGAPDFERNFQFQLEIPSAATRVTTTE